MSQGTYRIRVELPNGDVIDVSGNVPDVLDIALKKFLDHAIPFHAHRCRKCDTWTQSGFAWCPRCTDAHKEQETRFLPRPRPRISPVIR
jgi:tRNA(Ile2) C34 agmatinyltransferase TiaS